MTEGGGGYGNTLSLKKNYFLMNMRVECSETQELRIHCLTFIHLFISMHIINVNKSFKNYI